LKKQHIVDTKRFLEKSIRGESFSSDDMMDLSTEHQRPTRKMLKQHIHFDSNSESENSSSSQSTTPISSKNNKRKKTSDTKKSRKQPAKKRQRKTNISELSEGENKTTKSKKKSISFSP
jgi:hypothetical protein